MKIFNRFLLILVISYSCFGIIIVIKISNQHPPLYPTKGPWTLVWNDEFDGPALDQTKWVPLYRRCGYNDNQKDSQTNIDQTVTVAGGNLMLSSKVENWSEEGRNDPRSYGKYFFTASYTSGQVITGDKGAWTYGRFEIKAKLPVGERLISYANLYSVDGKSLREISILKMLGYDPYTIYVANRWGADQPRHYFNEDISSRGYYNLDYSDDFHIFAVDWEPRMIRWYIDDVEIYHTKRNVPEVPLSLSLETTANYPLAYDSKIIGRTISESQCLTVDWVRVYRRR